MSLLQIIVLIVLFVYISKRQTEEDGKILKYFNDKIRDLESKLETQERASKASYKLLRMKQTELFQALKSRNETDQDNELTDIAEGSENIGDR